MSEDLEWLDKAREFLMPERGLSKDDFLKNVVERLLQTVKGEGLKAQEYSELSGHPDSRPISRWTTNYSKSPQLLAMLFNKVDPAKYQERYVSLSSEAIPSTEWIDLPWQKKRIASQ